MPSANNASKSFAKQPQGMQQEPPTKVGANQHGHHHIISSNSGAIELDKNYTLSYQPGTLTNGGSSGLAESAVIPLNIQKLELSGGQSYNQGINPNLSGSGFSTKTVVKGKGNFQESGSRSIIGNLDDFGDGSVNAPFMEGLARQVKQTREGWIMDRTSVFNKIQQFQTKMGLLESNHKHTLNYLSAKVLQLQSDNRQLRKNFFELSVSHSRGQQTLRNDIWSITKSNNGLRENLDTVTGDVQSLMEIVGGDQSKISTLIAQRKTQDEAMSQINGKIVELEKLTATLNIDRQAASAQLQRRLNLGIEVLETEMKGHILDMTSRHQTIVVKHGALAKIVSGNADVAISKRADMQKDIDRLGARLGVAQQSIATASKKISDSEHKLCLQLTKFDAEIKKGTDNNSKLQVRLMQQIPKVDDVQKSINTLAIKFASLESKATIPGPKGDKGNDGEKGAPGPIGPKGSQGLQGPQGLKGPQGEKGEKGTDGKNGLDAQPGKDGINGLNGKDCICTPPPASKYSDLDFRLMEKQIAGIKQDILKSKIQSNNSKSGSDSKEMVDLKERFVRLETSGDIKAVRQEVGKVETKIMAEIYKVAVKVDTVQKQSEKQLLKISNLSQNMVVEDKLKSESLKIRQEIDALKTQTEIKPLSDRVLKLEVAVDSLSKADGKKTVAGGCNAPGGQPPDKNPDNDKKKNEGNNNKPDGNNGNKNNQNEGGNGGKGNEVNVSVKVNAEHAPCPPRFMAVENRVTTLQGKIGQLAKSALKSENLARELASLKELNIVQSAGGLAEQIGELTQMIHKMKHKMKLNAARLHLAESEGKKMRNAFDVLKAAGAVSQPCTKADIRQVQGRLRKQQFKLSNKLEGKLKGRMKIFEEANSLEKIRIKLEQPGDALKLISWNARTLSVMVGKNKVNKVSWVKYVTSAEVICIQETFSNQQAVGYQAFHGLKRFKMGDKKSVRNQMLQGKDEVVGLGYNSCVSIYVRNGIKAQYIVRAQLRVVILIHLGNYKVLVYNSYMKPKTALGRALSIKAELESHWTQLGKLCSDLKVNDWIWTGDYNYKRTDFLKVVKAPWMSDQVVSFRHPVTKEFGKIDFATSNKSRPQLLVMERLRKEWGWNLSDHCPIGYRIDVPQYVIGANEKISKQALDGRKAALGKQLGPVALAKQVQNSSKVQSVPLYNTNGIVKQVTQIKRITSLLQGYDQIQQLVGIMEQVNTVIEAALAARFTVDCKAAFATLFHVIGKKQAPVVTSVTLDDGSVVSGDKMDLEITHDFLGKHKDVCFEREVEEFPILNNQQKAQWKATIAEIVMKGGFGSGGAFDAIDRNTFKCRCKDNPRVKGEDGKLLPVERCQQCKNRANNMGCLVQSDYWKMLQKPIMFQTLMIKLMPLNKTGVPHPRLNDIRPICIQSHSVKFLQECLRGKLKAFVNQPRWKDGFMKNQHGFLAGRSTASAQAMLKESVLRLNAAATNEDELYSMFFVDIQDAYGSVSLVRLFGLLKTKWEVWSERQLAVLRFIYDNTAIKLNKHRVSPKRGLFQGAKLSCELFILYMCEVLDQLYATMEKSLIQVPPPETVAYVDDIVFVVKNSHLSSTILYVKQVFSKYGFKLNMKADGSKSAIMPFIPIQFKDKAEQVRKLVGNIAKTYQVPLATEYKYLGITIDEFLRPTKTIMKVAQKIESKYQLLGSALAIADYRFKVNCFWTFIVPMMMNIPLFEGQSKKYGENDNIFQYKVGAQDIVDFQKVFFRSAKVFLNLPMEAETQLVSDIVCTNPAKVKLFIEKLADPQNYNPKDAYNQLYSQNGPRFIGPADVIGEILAILSPGHGSFCGKCRNKGAQKILYYDHYKSHCIQDHCPTLMQVQRIAALQFQSKVPEVQIRQTWLTHLLYVKQLAKVEGQVQHGFFGHELGGQLIRSWESEEVVMVGEIHKAREVVAQVPEVVQEGQAALQSALQELAQSQDDDLVQAEKIKAMREAWFSSSSDEQSKVQSVVPPKQPAPTEPKKQQAQPSQPINNNPSPQQVVSEESNTHSSAVKKPKKLKTFGTKAEQQAFMAKLKEKKKLAQKKRREKKKEQRLAEKASMASSGSSSGTNGAVAGSNAKVTSTKQDNPKPQSNPPKSGKSGNNPGTASKDDAGKNKQANSGNGGQTKSDNTAAGKANNTPIIDSKTQVKGPDKPNKNNQSGRVTRNGDKTVNNQSGKPGNGHTNSKADPSSKPDKPVNRRKGKGGNKGKNNQQKQPDNKGKSKVNSKPAGARDRRYQQDQD